MAVYWLKKYNLCILERFWFNASFVKWWMKDAKIQACSRQVGTSFCHKNYYINSSSLWYTFTKIVLKRACVLRTWWHTDWDKLSAYEMELALFQILNSSVHMTF
jgi:hypothetical protein